MKTRIAVVILLLGLALQVSFGLFGTGRSQGGGFVFGVDFAYLYVAGQSWLNQANPYVFEIYSAHNTTPVSLPSGFVYLPQVSVFSMALALIPFDAAALLFGLINIAALILLAWSVQYLAANPVVTAPPRIGYPDNWLLAAIVMFSPAAANVTYMGQTSILVVVALIWGWVCAQKGQFLASSVLFAFAMIKPQLSLLPFLWICMSGKWRFYAGFAFTFALLGMGAWLTADPLTLARTWLDAIPQYHSMEFNQPGYWNVTSLQSLLIAAGVASPPGLSIVSILLAAAFWIFRRHFGRDDLLALLLLIGFCFIPAHTYDYIALVPVYAALWLYCRSRAHAVLFLSFVAAMYMPQQLVRRLDPQVLVHWRSLLVLGCLVFLALLSSRPTADPDRQRARS